MTFIASKFCVIEVVWVNGVVCLFFFLHLLRLLDLGFTESGDDVVAGAGAAGVAASIDVCCKICWGVGVVVMPAPVYKS